MKKWALIRQMLRRKLVNTKHLKVKPFHTSLSSSVLQYYDSSRIRYDIPECFLLHGRFFLLGNAET